MFLESKGRRFHVSTSLASFFVTMASSAWSGGHSWVKLVSGKELQTFGV